MAAAAELTSLKLAPFHNNYCSYSQNCSFFYRQAQSVIHTVHAVTRPSSPGSLRHTRSSQGLAARLYSVGLSYGLVISYMYIHPSTAPTQTIMCWLLA